MKTSARTVIPVLIAGLILTGACRSGLKTKLVGKWNDASDKTVWEFKSDDTVRVISKGEHGQESELSSGTYKVIDDETVELRLTRQREPLKANVQSLSNGELKISGAGIPPFVLTRIS